MPDEHVFVNAGFDFCDGVGARLVGHTLSLNGSIGVNFYMDLDESVADSDTAYMYFTIPGNTVTYQTVYVNEQSDASLPYAEKKTVGDKTYYVFPCSVAAKEIYSDITAQIIDGEDHGDSYTYSVKEYADYLLENANDKGTDEQKAYYAAKPLVEKMLQYGEYARAYFDDETLNSITDVEIPSDFEGYSASLPDNDTFAGATLSLKSETTLSLYIKKDSTISYAFCEDENINARTVETAASGGYQIIRIGNIAANELQYQYTVHFRIGNDPNTYYVKYKPMAYCYKVVNDGKSDGKLINLAKALYQYSQAANLYFGREG